MKEKWKNLVLIITLNLLEHMPMAKKWRKCWILSKIVKKKEKTFLKGKRYGCGKEYSLDGITRFECKFLYGVKCGYDKVFESGILVFKGELLNN